jgi:NAD(P)-dependent dehydrogenase (short-subunit alcohol dehydrogenase family)
MRQDTLIVGGYGVVGRRIAIDLAQDYPGRIVLGGRNLARANTCANEIGSGVRGRQIDIFDPQSIVAALDGVATVISCIDQPGRAVLHASISWPFVHGYYAPPHRARTRRGQSFEMVPAKLKRFPADLNRWDSQRVKDRRILVH